MIKRIIEAICVLLIYATITCGMWMICRLFWHWGGEILFVVYSVVSFIIYLCLTLFALLDFEDSQELGAPAEWYMEQMKHARDRHPHTHEILDEE
jgi:fatty acid desaturase